MQDYYTQMQKVEELKSQIQFPRLESLPADFLTQMEEYVKDAPRNMDSAGTVQVKVGPPWFSGFSVSITRVTIWQTHLLLKSVLLLLPRRGGGTVPWSSHVHLSPSLFAKELANIDNRLPLRLTQQGFVCNDRYQHKLRHALFMFAPTLIWTR